VRIIALFFGTLLALSSKSQTKEPLLKFADPLTEHMVIQQNQLFRVWGQAPGNQLVEIEADWLKTTVTVRADEHGNFIGAIVVPKVKPGDFTKHKLTIRSGNAAVSLNDLLIGEVWFCSGQSNMQSPVSELVNGKAEVAAANYENIRLFNASLNFSNSPLREITGKWVVCTPASVEKFSGVAYFFARQLYTVLNVPVGVIFSGIGASAAQAYVPREVLASDPLLDSVYLDPYLASERSKEIIDGGFSFEKVTRPFLLYNAMIHPFKDLSIKGFCWYQGESNRKERHRYTHLMHALIKSWRSEFAQGELPFYYVQVAPFYWDQEDPDLADYAFFREAQENIGALNNTEMIVTMDVGESRDLHPKNKKPIGIRLALAALHKTYSDLSVVYKGPRIKTVDFSKSKAVVRYFDDSVQGGLRTNDGKPPKYFSLAGADGRFYPAEASITDNSVVVTSPKVKQPVGLRYAFTNYPVTNLENAHGLPALPFRTDTWSELIEMK
jgi:sialate O-acetylesterase